MKCSWKYDCSDLLQRKMSYIFFVTIPVIFSFFFQIYHEIGPKQVEILIGMKLNSDFPIDVLVYLWNVGFFIYLAFQLFTNQFHTSYEYFFCRLSKEKWICYKLIFLFLITFCYKLIFLFCLFLFSSYSLKELLILGGCNVLFTFCLQLLVLVLYGLWLKKKVLVLILFLLLIGILFYLAEFVEINIFVFYQLCFLFLFLFFLFVVFFKKELANLFERSS